MPEEYGLAGTCTSCGSRMIEYADAVGREERTIQFECQSDDCTQTGLIRHGLDDESVADPSQQQGVEDVEVVELNWSRCPRCDGDGWIHGTWCDLERAMNGRDTPCPNCDTSGRVPRIVETDGGTQRNGTDRCKHCGSEIDGEPLNQLSALEFDDEAAEEDGFTEVKATYGDGPYCSFTCLNAPENEKHSTETDRQQGGRDV